MACPFWSSLYKRACFNFSPAKVSIRSVARIFQVCAQFSKLTLTSYSVLSQRFPVTFATSVNKVRLCVDEMALAIGEKIRLDTLPSRTTLTFC